MFSTPSLRTAGAIAAVTLLASACGGSTDATTDPTAPTGTATGTLPIAGSSTVGPISQLVAEDFGGAASVEITGTGGGFKERFCTGETAINNASRQIKPAERELCAENGIDNILELKIAVDGITIMTSTDNDTDVECLNTAEIWALVGPAAGDVATWADAGAVLAEYGLTGHNASLPNVPLVTAGPGTESGTYDSFWELALEHLNEETGFADEKFRPDWTGSNDDNVILSGIAGNQYSFGWVGYAYFTEVADKVRAFAVADEDGACIEPTPETIADNSYPLARDLYVYVNIDALDDPTYGDTLRAYIDYQLSDAGRELIDEVGYVQLTDADVADARQAWSDATASAA